MGLNIQVLAFKVHETLAEKTNGDIKLCGHCRLQLLEKIIGPVFGMIGNTMVDSFSRRAREIYGETRLD